MSKKILEDKLKSAISSLGKKHNIPTGEIRIRILKPKKDLEFHVYRGKLDFIESVTIATLFDINSFLAFPVLITVNKIFNEIFNDFLKQNAIKESEIDKKTVDIRVWTKTEDCYPLFNLYYNNDNVRKIENEEIESLI